MFNKILSVLTVLCLVCSSFGILTYATYDTSSSGVLAFDSDGKLKIMHVTDTHLEESNVDDSVWLIGDACDRENPDIVVITGDNVQNCDNSEDTKKLIDKLMNVFETRSIPVAVTFGNHDSETGAMNREELMAYYNTYSCSFSVDDGENLSGCGTYNIPVKSSDGKKIAFNLWIFDSGDYDSEGHYGCVQKDQVEWYKMESDLLALQNNGKRVNSLVFQHIIVPEVYDALSKTDSQKLFSFEHMYNDNEYYMFNPDVKNYGTLNETPCCGYENYGQFDAMAEKGDVLAMFTGHDHTNAFGVEYKGIDIVNSLSTRYNRDSYSTQYGYRIIEVDESDTSVYSSRVVHWYDMISAKDVVDYMSSGDNFGFSVALDVLFRGVFQKAINEIYRGFVYCITGRQVSYPD